MLSELDNRPSAEYPGLVKRIEIAPSAFAKYEFWKEDGYARNCIKKTDAYELILLCWEPRQVTPIHCHNKQECWVYVVDGELTENFYGSNENDQPVFKKSEKRSASQYTFMHDEMGFHDIDNSSNERCMTLHLYAGPVARCRIYDKELGVFVWRDLTYDTYDGKQLSAVE